MNQADHAEQAAESLLRCQTDVNDMHAMARETLQLLEVQGDQLQRSAQHNEGIHRDIEQGHRQLTLMESWFSWLPRPSLWGAGTPARRETATATPRSGRAPPRTALLAQKDHSDASVDEALSECSDDDFVRLLSATELDSIAAASSGNFTAAYSHADPTEVELTRNLRTLRALAGDIGTVLDEQNATLKTLQGDVDASAARVVAARRRADAL